jgi:WD40 repeat protein
MALHPYRNILATGGKDGVILWNLEEGKMLTRLRESNGWIQSLAFSPNGRYLATGSYDSVVRIWEDALSNF